MAPELLSRQTYKDCYATDVFAAGVTLFKIACNQHPFASREATINGKISTFPLYIFGTQLLVNIIDEMLGHNATKRISIDEILQHPWTLKAFTALSAKSAVTLLKFQK